jgi:hypothetical protein
MRNPQRVGVTFLAVGLVTALGCGGVTGPAKPRYIPGGGVGDGDIDGTLFVYVADEDARTVLPGATVRVGASNAASPCTATTDGTGLASFTSETCPGLKGKQTVTITATGYAPATVIGMNATNLTSTLRPTVRPDVPTATVSGTIAGWDALPDPPLGHQLLALVGYSQAPELGDRANDIKQGTRSIAVTGLGMTDIAANICVRNVLADDCNWTLTTRTGAQAHYAVILDADPRGTDNDDSDDVLTVIGWALKTNLTFAAGQSASGETLTIIPAADMQPLSAAFSSMPAGLTYVASYPMLNLGDAGRIPIVVPALDLQHTMTSVPKATGPLAGASYDLIAQARSTKENDVPGSLTWRRGIDVTKTATVDKWLATPSVVAVAAGTYSFAASAEASLHSADIESPDGSRLWAVTIFDGSTSFTLPALTPDPIPAGPARLKVSALKIPGLDLNDAVFDDLQDRITDLSTNAITFTH